MKNKFKINYSSIRTKVFGLFVCFVLFGAILLATNNYFYSEKLKLYKKLNKLTEFESEVNEALFYQSNIMLKDFSTEQYYSTKKSKYTLAYQKHIKKAFKHLKKIPSNKTKKNKTLQEKYSDCKNDLFMTNKYFEKIIYLQKLRGFKDEGMEGRMRSYAHALESELKNSPLAIHVLQIRRHEKDFFMRGDSVYAEKLRLESSILNNKLSNVTLRETLSKYNQTFDSIAQIDYINGIKTQTGYFNMIQIYAQQVHESTNELYKAYSNFYKKTLENISNVNVFVTFILLSIAILLSVFLANSITARIRMLSDFMSIYVKSRFKTQSRFEPDFHKDEITTMIKNFEVLENEISVQFEKYKTNVEQRTEEIIAQKEELFKQKKLIEQKNEILTEQKNILDLQNQHIYDNLRAAHELQKSFFPSKEKMNQLLGQHFLGFYPIDIVSGDFYWVEQTENGTYIALADCTGHGAQGALMSINGINLLNDALNEKKLIQPDEILNYISSKLSTQFYRFDESHKHTMDISLIRIDGHRLYFSGAQQGIIYMQNGNSELIQGDRRPLGWNYNDEVHLFTLSTLTIEEEDKIILFTDGIVDQFGGPENKKLKRTRLMEVINKNNTSDINELYNIITDELIRWKEGQSQTDDISYLICNVKELRLHQKTSVLSSFEKSITI